MPLLLQRLTSLSSILVVLFTYLVVSHACTRVLIVYITFKCLPLAPFKISLLCLRSWSLVKYDAGSTDTFAPISILNLIILEESIIIHKESLSYLILTIFSIYIWPIIILLAQLSWTSSCILTSSTLLFLHGLE